MDSPAQRVLVVRAWREPEGIRVRVLTEGRHWVAGSVSGALEVVGALLTELAPGHRD
jgi:hypothetical protein